MAAEELHKFDPFFFFEGISLIHLGPRFCFEMCLSPRYNLFFLIIVADHHVIMLFWPISIMNNCS